jgi:hypothetical protein
MTFALNEPFDDPEGRWNEYAPWDSTEAFESLKGFLTTQRHVDLRSFRNIFDLFPAPQFPDVDVPSQDTIEMGDQTMMETNETVNLVDENWTMPATTGTTAFTVGKIAARGGWSGFQADMDGSDLAVEIQSNLTLGIDLSDMVYLSFVAPDYNDFDMFTSSIQLTSDPNGIFGNGYDSDICPFNNNLSATPHFLFDLFGDFAMSADPSFTLNKITGVKIIAVSAGTPGSPTTLTLMALRGFVPDWEESWLDFDTRIGAICVPVTVEGTPYGGTVAQHFEFVRGDGGHEDPYPADLALTMFFYPGGQTSPNDATGPDYNKLSFILREKKDIPDGTGSHIEVNLFFNDSQTTFEALRVDTTGGSPPGVITNDGDFNIAIGGALDPEKHYAFTVNLTGTQISASLFEANFFEETSNILVWRLDTTLTDEAYEYRNGRVGFIGDLLTRDAYITGIVVAPTGFAELQTARYQSRTPVDGARLATVASPDINLWNSFSGSDILIDQTKTLSGNGSYRTQKSLTSNTFIMDDWTQSYLDVAIWVPNIVTRANQPVILLNTEAGQENIALPKLQPAQWNVLHFDLGLFRNLITGVGYSIVIQAATNPDRPLGNFWVDDVVIGRRRVAWYARAQVNGPYRPFKDLVNNAKGAVHFNPEERGTDLEVKAVALTEDAWVASFKVFPRYAQLGLPVYDQGFEKR